MKLSRDWLAVPPGQIYPVQFAAGTACPADLIDDARRAGVLALDIETAATSAAPETKRPRRK